jgi:hypothetical protein
MFGKKKDDDPKKALEDASNVLNKGLMGGLTKAFMGKDFVDKANAGIAMGNQALDQQAIAQNLRQNGTDGIAEVVSITDTGATVNMNPVCVLMLKITPTAGGPEFQTYAQMEVPRLTIPRAGEKVKVKYNPAVPSQVVIV